MCFITHMHHAYDMHDLTWLKLFQIHFMKKTAADSQKNRTPRGGNMWECEKVMHPVLGF